MFKMPGWFRQLIGAEPSAPQFSFKSKPRTPQRAVEIVPKTAEHPALDESLPEGCLNDFEVAQVRREGLANAPESVLVHVSECLDCRQRVRRDTNSPPRSA